MADKKPIDESHHVTRRKGGGILRREVWVDEDGNVTRYNLAYINRELYQSDNGRVVGYDNAHGYHHRHYFGTIEPVEFVSFEGVEEQFARDWIALRSQA
ncbi:toxin-antitoxin system TumE family protein [Paraburkholderia solisilvae]|uniref:Uncharacterized protein n=1 Tax=Paraburkholderia solisilvae TaxID=624376 RepID=A0A6J5EV80_9BURK|nr:DUF6516 family protein [Paraburkholderia solisilvae]CAB3770480.1 hypothetical protein LMG29739_05795 [Paraburkholderia solisilvae]